MVYLLSLESEIINEVKVMLKQALDSLRSPAANALFQDEEKELAQMGTWNWNEQLGNVLIDASSNFKLFLMLANA